MKSFLLIFLCLIDLEIHSQEVYKIDPFKTHISIDGQPNEKIWRQLPYSNEFVLMKGKVKSKYPTKFKAFADRENLYILIELTGQELKVVLSKASDFDKKSHSFNSDHLILFFAPRQEVDDHFCVKVDFKGHIESCFVPAKSGQGFPFSSEVNWSWESSIEAAISSIDKSIFFEIKVPVAPLSLQGNLFRGCLKTLVFC